MGSAAFYSASKRKILPMESTYENVFIVKRMRNYSGLTGQQGLLFDEPFEDHRLITEHIAGLFLCWRSP
jgi:hypothetical protein